jgi:inosine-uridine nucleoside N-ribohydrolase
MKHLVRTPQIVRNFRACALLALSLLPSIRSTCGQDLKTLHQPPDLVVIDTDIGDDIDDVIAVGLALATPELKVLAINSAWGDTTLRARMLDRLLHELSREDITVGVGIEKHKAGEAAFSQAAWARRQLARPHPGAVDLLLKTIAEHPHQITLIAIAPLTNVAAAYERDPVTFKLLKRIVTMGGSVRLGYDEFAWSLPRGAVQEYNIVMDIPAAQKVYSSGVPIYMMPLDSTQIKIDELKRKQLFTRSTPFTDALTLLYFQWTRTTRQQTPTAFDAMAAAYAADPEICPVTQMRIRVDDQGYTREESGTPNVSACLQSDSDTFFRYFMPRILAFDSTAKTEELDATK